jgi:hypothetical protein
MFAPSPQPDDNPSYAKLKRDLGDDAPLLNFLPYKRATFEPQNEIAEAAPERLLYGDMLESKGQLWIYWTLNYHKKKSHLNYRMITFQTIEGAKNHEAGVRPTTVQKVALASWPFKHAKDHHALSAIAKYFFVRKGIDTQLQYPMSCGPFKEPLVRVCQQYKAIYNDTHANKAASRRSSIMPTGGSHGMSNSHPHDLRETSYGAPMGPSLVYSPAPSSGPAHAEFHAPSRAMSRGSSRPTSRGGVDGRKRRHSRSPEHYTAPARHNVTGGEPGGFTSYSRPPSPFLTTVRSPLHERPENAEVEDLQAGNNNDVDFEQVAGGEGSGEIDREAMMDQYIALKAREEELDNKISDMETERARIADQVAELQADINAIGDRKGDLEDQKNRVRAEKMRLQVQLDKDEHLDFGFEAGRRMEIKRRRRE